MNGNVESALSKILQRLISVLSATLTDHVILHRTLMMLPRYHDYAVVYIVPSLLLIIVYWHDNNSHVFLPIV